MVDFIDNFWVKLFFAFLLSLIPVFLWINIIRTKGESDKSELKKAFFFGILSVMPILGLQYAWAFMPEFDLYSLLRNSTDNAHVGIVLTAILTGVLEELTKFLSLANLRWWKVDIKNINQAIILILATALGFAFTENILYFLTIMRTGSFEDLYSAFVLRSLFTTAAHMLFSGIVAYYYAIGKFGKPILEMDYWSGKKHRIASFFRRIFGIKEKTIFQFSNLGFGLFVAMLLHAAYNATLQFNRMDYAFAIVIIGFLMVIYLSQKRVSYLVFTSEEKARPSTIGKQEEETVIELVSVWLQEGKYSEVIEICDRLLDRDPDNNLIKLIKAKAVDRRKFARVRKAFSSLFSKEDKSLSEAEKSIFEKYGKKKD